MPLDPRLGPSRSRCGVAASDTTYHSFHDIELFPPASPPKDKDRDGSKQHSVRGKTATEPAPVPQPQLSRQKENQPPPTAATTAAAAAPPPSHPSTTEMKRQDSGYESLPPRTSISSSGSKRRISTASISGSSPAHHHQQQQQQQQQQTTRTGSQSRPGSRGRPVIRRSPKTSPYPVRAVTGQANALYSARSHPSDFSHIDTRGSHHARVNPHPQAQAQAQAHPHQHSQQMQQVQHGQQRHRHRHSHDHTHSGFFHFPAHPTDLRDSSSSTYGTPPYPYQFNNHQQQRPDAANPANPYRDSPYGDGDIPSPESRSETPLQSPPPQSTHYWTSNHTRRLEYAAIDAAHRGLKGWLRRHLVPECFAPKEKARVAFDDETGSVRRYRLEMDDEGSCVGGMVDDGSRDAREEGPKPKGWGWGRIKSW